jgi:hypothetical protein
MNQVQRMMPAVASEQRMVQREFSEYSGSEACAERL